MNGITVISVSLSKPMAPLWLFSHSHLPHLDLPFRNRCPVFPLFLLPQPSHHSSHLDYCSCVNSSNLFSITEPDGTFKMQTNHVTSSWNTEGRPIITHQNPDSLSRPARPQLLSQSASVLCDTVSPLLFRSPWHVLLGVTSYFAPWALFLLYVITSLIIHFLHHCDSKLHDSRTLAVLLIMEHSHGKHWWPVNKWLFQHVWFWGWGWRLSCFSQVIPVRMAGQVQFSSRQLNLTNSYYWVFIMLYWACHRSWRRQGLCPQRRLPNLTCHLLASCCSWADGSESECHWCPDFRNCLDASAPPWSPVCPHFSRCASVWTRPEFASFISMRKELCNDWVLSKEFQSPTATCPWSWGDKQFPHKITFYNRSYSRRRSWAEISIPSFASWSWTNLDFFHA